MHFSTITSIATLFAAASQAGVIDTRESTDGVFSGGRKVADLPVKRDLATRESTDGIFTAGRKVADLPTKRDIQGEELTSLVTRDHDDCDYFKDGNTIGLQPEFADHARDALTGYCARNSNNCGTESIWAKSGDVVVFFCKYHSPAKWDEKSLKWSLDHVAGKCGEHHAGSNWDDDRTWAYGWTQWKEHGWCDMQPGYQF